MSGWMRGRWCCGHGEPYTGTKLETADTAKGSLRIVTPVLYSTPPPTAVSHRGEVGAKRALGAAGGVVDVRGEPLQLFVLGRVDGHQEVADGEHADQLVVGDDREVAHV